MPDEQEDAKLEGTDSSSAAAPAKDASAASSSGKDAKQSPLGEVIKGILEKSSDSAEAEEVQPEADTTLAEEDATANEPDSVEQEEETETTAEAEEPGEVEVEAEAEDAKLEFHKHPRFKSLLADSKKLREVEPLAQQAKVLNDYCAENHISSTQVREALEFVAILNGDPKVARQKLSELTDTIDLHLGTKYPADIQEALDKQEITPEVAKSWAQSKLEAARAKHGGETARQSAEQQAQQAQVSALNSWGANKGKTDTAFKPKVNGAADGKYEYVVLKLQQLAATNAPTTPEAAIALAEQAYVSVSKTFSKMTPGKPARKSITSGRSTNAGEHKEDPKNLKEAVKRLLAGEKLSMLSAHR